MQKSDIEKLKAWFLSQSRDLPWRNKPSPYAVWISEVMLQQTQVATVIPYFLRWMQRFPSIQALANAPLEEILKAWEGLGYYSRARNLHEGARYIVSHFNGQLPSSPEALEQIKGLGAYTIGAILSFAFHQRTPAVDGNVLRVLTRFYGIDDDIAKAKTLQKIRSLALDLLPEKEPWIIAEALIELGATVCSKKAKCSECPLNAHCHAFKHDLVHTLPVKCAKVAITSLYRSVAVIVHENSLLVTRGEKGKIMADLCEFPYLEHSQPPSDYLSIQQHLQQSHKLQLDWKQTLKPVKHSFTRYKAQLFPHIFNAKKRQDIENYSWISLSDLNKYPFSSGHKRIFASLDLHEG